MVRFSLTLTHPENTIAVMQLYLIQNTILILIKKEAQPQHTTKAKGTLITTAAKEKETQTNNHDHEEHLDISSTTLFDGGQMSC